jgi:lipopolysaccharide/colanic/teichoic acid biosynthesis glycosyltransferase
VTMAVPAPVLPARHADASAAESCRTWGLTPADMLDRYWAVKGIQVVRRGEGATAQRGPAMYLLIEPGELVLFELAPLVKRFNRLKPRALRLRVRDDSTRPYSETVLADGQDRFIAIRRSYRALTRSTTRAWLTPDRSLARLWAAGSDARATIGQVREAVGRRGIVSMAIKGRVYDDPEHAPDFVRVLTDKWKDPGVIIEDVYEHAPGVWVDENAEVPEGVRFVAPVWVGAGAALKPGDVVVGPAFTSDAPGVHPKAQPIAWDQLALPSYRLLPRVRSGRAGKAAKRAFDVAFSLAVLLATAPLFPLIILAIWIEDGWPPFFAHTRQTIHGRLFPCYKFRTMNRNAERLKARLVGANICDGPQFFIADDPRVLRVGRVLRRFQLDELPQFWNVLLGHMSVVGPRPSPDKENQFCPAWREARLSVRPGITGLWQVRRTRLPQTDFQEWIRYDLEYVQHASWRLDMWIIMQTIKKVLGG